jgi:cation/acetate symporter
MVVLSASVWEAVLGFPKGSAPFPYSNPALFSMTIAFLGIWLGSKMDDSAQAQNERAAFEAQQLRSETGIGIAKASAH